MAQVDVLKQAAQALTDSVAKLGPAIDALKAKVVPEDPVVQSTIDMAVAQVQAATVAVDAAVANASA